MLVVRMLRPGRTERLVVVGGEFGQAVARLLTAPERRGR